MESVDYHSSNSENESSYSTEEENKTQNTKKNKNKLLESLDDLPQKSQKKPVKRPIKEENDGGNTKKSKNNKTEPKSEEEKKATKERKREPKPKTEKEVKEPKPQKSPKNKATLITLANEEYKISQDYITFNKRMEFKTGQCIEIPIHELTRFDMETFRETQKPIDFLVQFSQDSNNLNYLLLHVLQNFNSSIGQKICILLQQ